MNNTKLKIPKGRREKPFDRFVSSVISTIVMFVKRDQIRERDKMKNEK